MEAFTELARRGIFQLNIRFAADRVLIASFILRQNDSNALSTIPSTPVSVSTEDPKVFEKAKEWIEECRTTHDQCQLLINPKWHPNRLLDLTGSTADQDPSIDGPYVTLSHCWGTQSFLKLKRDNLTEFLNGISMAALPKTFQHAAKVCHELNIRWLWIDALCIIQEDNGLVDWLEESARMEQIYANSYCNISATASKDSSQGLFRRRDVGQEWMAVAELDTKDLLAQSRGRVQCTIMDLEFWDKYIDRAPVNQRAWVFSERLLAPRILHWCGNQIAFKCGQIDRAEGLPDHIPQFRDRGGLLTQTDSIKGINAAAGARLRAVREARSGSSSRTRARLQRQVDEVEDVDRRFYVYELWKHWVQVYTKTHLTNHRDRLIAISGIAKMMCSRLIAEGHDEEYVAGMWREHILVHLLWHVNEGKGKDWQLFEHTRPTEYRAPTLSWASVETPRGVSFPVTRDLAGDEGPLAEVESVHLTYRNPADPLA